MKTLASDARRAPLFAGLEEAACEKILLAARPQQAAPGEILFRQGEPSQQILLLVHGLIRMSQSVSREGQATLRLMRAGELIGCVAAIRGFPYPATATTLEESRLLSWATSDFLELMKSQPALAHNILTIVGDRTREMVEHIGDLSRKTIEERLAAALLRLSRQAGVAIDGRTQIKASNAREDLAALAGAGYFTISRTLSDWQKQGIIRNGRHRIIIIDESRLETIATGGA